MFSRWLTSRLTIEQGSGEGGDDVLCQLIISTSTESLKFPTQTHNIFVLAKKKVQCQKVTMSWVSNATSKQPVGFRAATATENNSKAQFSSEETKINSWIESFAFCCCGCEALMVRRSFKLSEWKNVVLNRFAESSHVLSFQILFLTEGVDSLSEGFGDKRQTSSLL